MRAAKLVVIESPFAGDVEKHLRYARACMRDSLMRGEYPIASHLLYTQDGILDDTQPSDRQLGIHAGLAWGKYADITAVYMDCGISKGMDYSIAAAHKVNRPVEYRTLDEWQP